MRRRCVSRSVFRPPCELGGMVATKLESPVNSESKLTNTTKSREAPIRAFSGIHFCSSVISRGQHDTAPFGLGLRFSPGPDGMPLEWWQLSMSAMSPVWLPCPALLEDGATFTCDSAIAGCAQPMTQASKAIHKEVPTAVPALTMCRRLRIFFLLYTGFGG